MTPSIWSHPNMGIMATIFLMPTDASQFYPAPKYPRGRATAPPGSEPNYQRKKPCSTFKGAIKCGMEWDSAASQSRPIDLRVPTGLCQALPRLPACSPTVTLMDRDSPPQLGSR